MEIRVLVAVASLLLGTQPTTKPAAMVLDARGRVEVTHAGEAPRPIAVGELLNPADRLSVPADGSLTLAILGIGAKETIKPGSSATVDPKGCTPPEAVAARSAQRPAVAGVMKGVRPSPGNPHKAGVEFRGTQGPPEAPPSVSPVYNATVASDRPTLAWKPVTGARGYRVRLLSAAGRELWKADSREPRLAFPDGAEALQRGYVYDWEVSDSTGKRMASSTFTVATASEASDLAELAPLAAGDDRADLLAAAMAYEKLRAYDEAMAVYEKLAKLAPEEPAYRDALAVLYERAGRPEDARVIVERTKR